MTKLVFNALTGTFDLVQNLSGYALLAGRAGGQVLVGGSAVTDALVLQGTSGNGTLASPSVQLKVGNNGGTVAMTALNNGNVGIGTTTPLAALDVNGVTRALSSAGTAPTGGIGLEYFYKASTDTGNIYSYDRTNSIYKDLNLNDKVRIIGSTGKVGIGTTSPTAKLDISTGNLNLDNTTNANQYGVISKGGTRFIHNFNYGNNGTVTTEGYNVFVGQDVGNLTMGSTATQTYHASYNTAVGYRSLYSNTTGYQNSAQGHASLYSNTTGYSNSAQGTYSLYLNNTGYQNSAQGHASLYSNTTGYSNSAQGYASLQFNTTGYQNSAQGHRSLYSNTTGYQNSAQGYRSLYSNTTGYQNSALGTSAGRYIADGATGRTTGNNGLYLGYNSKASADGTDNEIAIGYNAIGAGSNSVVLGNASVTKTLLNGNVGIGTTSPTAVLHLKAGTATANTAPLKLTSGTLNTTPEAGAVEFLTDDFFATITTGAARKAFVLDDGTRLTSGRIPFATTNGRLTDDADLTFATDTLTATKMVGTTSIKVGTAGGYLSSDGSAGATGTFTTVDGKTCTVKDGLITSIV